MKVYLLSEMKPDFVRKLLLSPVSDLQAAVDAALAGLQAGAKIGVMPSANATIPVPLGTI